MTKVVATRIRSPGSNFYDSTISRKKVVFSEIEVGWLSFFVHQWDKYYIRHSPTVPQRYMKRLPGDDVKDQVYATFFSAASRDVVAENRDTCRRMPEGKSCAIT